MVGFYATITFIIILLFFVEFDDDDDQDGGKLIPAYQRTD